MNRLHHLKVTLPKNIRDHRNHPNARFLLLDYNSKDGLEEWVKQNFSGEIASGKLTYYKTTEPQSFNRSHSRNLAFKLVQEGMICNLDADNFTGPDFYQYICRLVAANKPCLLAVDKMNLNGALRDVIGRFCISKDDFYKVRGLDESMQDYGFEDTDLISRVQASGKELVFMDKKKYLKAIPHSNVERYAEETITKKTLNVFISYISPSLTDIILIYNDHTFEKGTLFDNVSYYFQTKTSGKDLEGQNYPRYLIQKVWEKGHWEQNGDNYIFYSEQGPSFLMETETENSKETGRIGESVYQSIVNNHFLLSQIKEFYSTMNNWKKMQENQNRNINEINRDGYGKGIVYKNFSSTPVSID